MGDQSYLRSRVRVRVSLMGDQSYLRSRVRVRVS